MPTEDSAETRVILVTRENGEKDFTIRIPINAKTTFAPWSPPSKYNGNTYNPQGTLRVYRTEKDILAVFSGVTGFRDASLDYAEKVIVEEGSTVWKNDKGEYSRTTKGTRVESWETPSTPELDA